MVTIAHVNLLLLVYCVNIRLYPWESCKSFTPTTGEYKHKEKQKTVHSLATREVPDIRFVQLIFL